MDATVANRPPPKPPGEVLRDAAAVEKFRSKATNERLITFSQLLKQSRAIPCFCVAVDDGGDLLLCSTGDFTRQEVLEILIGMTRLIEQHPSYIQEP